MNRFGLWLEARAASTARTPEDVWPLPPEKRLRGMRTVNGSGVRLGTWSRPDASGKRFATRWVSILGMPIFPTSRLYLQQGRTQHGYQRTRTEYQIYGRARLRPSEIIRTYLFFWLIAPGFILGPADLIGNQNSAAGIVWFFAALFLTAGASAFYQRHIAPIYEARWMQHGSRTVRQ